MFKNNNLIIINSSLKNSKMIVFSLCIQKHNGLMEQFKIANRIWIEKGGFSFLGAGKVALLEAIIEHGSISRAAKSLEMSYKKAWEMINSMNKLSEEPIVIRETGGSGGGGTSVTEIGVNLISEYRNLQTKCSKFLEEELSNCSFIP